MTREEYAEAAFVSVYVSDVFGNCGYVVQA